MSASAEIALHGRLGAAQMAQRALKAETMKCRSALVEFMDEALQHHWSWNRIGEALGISGTGARRYYERNRRLVRSV